MCVSADLLHTNAYSVYVKASASLFLVVCVTERQIERESEREKLIL